MKIDGGVYMKKNLFLLVISSMILIFGCNSSDSGLNEKINQLTESNATLLQEQKVMGETIADLEKKIESLESEIKKMADELKNTVKKPVDFSDTKLYENHLLDFELDFNNGMPTAQNKESGFKSFRDFESEL